MSFELYRHFNASGELLYVGISTSAFKRLARHRAAEWFAEIKTITIERFATRVEASAAEKAAIINERPRYNIQYGTYRPAPDGAMTIFELADALNRRPGQIRRDIQLDRFPIPVKREASCKHHGRYYWLRKDVAEYLASRSEH